MYGIECNGKLVALLCMNFLVLDAGSAIYIPADGIHANLSGNIIECIAVPTTSSILVSALGLIDFFDLFVNALTFQQHDPEEPILKRQKSEKSTNGKTDAFKPPMSEFNMVFTALVAGGRGDSKGDQGTKYCCCGQWERKDECRRQGF